MTTILATSITESPSHHSLKHNNNDKFNISEKQNQHNISGIYKGYIIHSTLDTPPVHISRRFSNQQPHLLCTHEICPRGEHFYTGANGAIIQMSSIQMWYRYVHLEFIYIFAPSSIVHLQGSSAHLQSTISTYGMRCI